MLPKGTHIAEMDISYGGPGHQLIVGPIIIIK
jgi:hypothetical protein